MSATLQLAVCLTWPLLPGAGEPSVRSFDYGLLPQGAWACLGSPRFVGESPCRSVSFSPDGKWLATGSAEYGRGGNAVRIWDLSSGREMHTLRGHLAQVVAVRFTPDSKTLLSAAWDNTIRVWDVATGEELRQLKGHDRVVTGLELTPDGKQLVSSSQDGTIRVWDFATGKEQRRIEWTASEIALASDGRTLAVAGGDVRLWDLRTGKQICQLEETDDARGVRFAPDGKRLAVRTYSAVSLWEVATGKEFLRLKGLKRHVGALAFSPDGKVLATGGAGYEKPGPFFEGFLVELKLWDVVDGKELRSCEGHSFYVTDLAFSPDGRMLASASGDFSARLWDWKTGGEAPQFLGHSQEVTRLAFTPNGRTLCSASGDGTVRLWDTVGRTEQVVLRGHTKYVSAMAVAPDGKVLASGSNDGTVRLWDLSKRCALRTLAEGQGNVWCVAFSPDNRMLAYGDRGYAGAGGVLRLWDWKAGKELHRLPEQGGAHCLAFTPDSKTVAVGHHPHIYAWDATTGKVLEKLEPAHGEWVNGVDYLPDGTLVSVGTGNGVLTHALRLWDAQCKKRLHEFGTGTGYHSTMAVSPDGRLVAAAFETNIHVWELSTRHKVFEFRGHRRHVGALAFSPDGQNLVSGGADGALLYWDLTGHRRGTKLAPSPIKAEDLNDLWRDLQENEGGRRSVWRLALAPREAVPFLAERVRPIGKADGKPSTPGERLSVSVIQNLRAIEALEWAGTREAKEVLRKIADGEASDRLTLAARAAIRRLEFRPE